MSTRIRRLIGVVGCLLAAFVWFMPAESQDRVDDNSGERSAEVQDESGEGYERAIQNKLKEIGESLKDLKVRAEKAGGKVKAELQEAMKDLQQKLDAAQDEWQKFKSSGAEAWDRAKSKMDAAMKDLQGYYERMTTRLKKSNSQEQS